MKVMIYNFWSQQSHSFGLSDFSRCWVDHRKLGSVGHRVSWPEDYLQINCSRIWLVKDAKLHSEKSFFLEATGPIL